MSAHRDRDHGGLTLSAPSCVAGRVLALGLVFGCGTTEAPSHEAIPAVGSAPLPVAFAGCVEVLRDAEGRLRCTLDADGPTMLHLWTAIVDPDLRLELDGRRIEAVASVSEDDPGTAWTIAVPSDATIISVADEVRRWALPLAIEPPPDPVIATARASLHDPVRAKPFVDALLGSAWLPSRAIGWTLLRRQRYASGHFDAALEAAEHGFVLSEQLGRPSEACGHAEVAAFIAIVRRGDPALALAWIERGLGCARDDPSWQPRTHFGRGLVLQRTRDLRGALAEFVLAGRIARRLDLRADEAAALDMQAAVLTDLGNHDRAAELRGQVLAAVHDESDPFAYASALNNHGWALALRDDARADEAIEPLRRAIEIYDRHGAHDAAHARLNLAYAYLEAGDWAAADATLGAVDEGWLDVRQRLWRAELATRILVARGRLGPAARALRRWAAAVEAVDDPEFAWRLDLGRGEFEEARGRFDGARLAYAEAERRLDGLVVDVAMELGRQEFTAHRHRSARRAVALLVGAERFAEALCVVRWARSRALRTMDLAARLSAGDMTFEAARLAYLGERDRLDAWRADADDDPLDRLARARAAIARARAQLHANLADALTVGPARPSPADPWRCRELPPLDPADLVLAPFPMDNGWLVLAAHDGEVRATMTPPIRPDDDPEAIARAVLTPFATFVDRAQRIRTFSTGAWVQLPLPALPWRGDAIAARLPVVEGLDLPPLEPPNEPWTEATERALVVFADPDRDLAHVRDDLSGLGPRLAARGFGVHELLGSAASGPAVRAQLDGVDLFQFFGHAETSAWIDADSSAWSASLRLADGTSLGIDDVFLLRRPPRTVVLLGCRTGVPDPNAPVSEGPSLAHAFIAAGTQSVVATTADVDPEVAAAIAIALIDAPRGDRFEAPAALRRAWLAVRGSSSQWSDFRVFER